MISTLNIQSELRSDLQPGDIFLTSNDTALQKSVNWIQRFWSKDDKSRYGHAGIIISETGDTFESQWKVMSKNIWRDYSNSKFLIARHSWMTPEKFNNAFDQIYREHNGQYYPVYRILFYLYPPLTKLSAGRLVCSELVAKFLYLCDMMPFFNGCNPDYLHDHIMWGIKEGPWRIVFINWR